MKRTLGIIMILALATGMATNTLAKAERREQPKARFVQETLEALGEPHYLEKMKVKRIASIPVGDTFYHVFEGKLDTVGYHIIVFDNYLNYLGFYKSDFPPTNEEKENCISIDSGDVNDDGDPLFFWIPIDPEKGLPSKLQIGGTPTKLEKGPEIEGKEEGGPKAAKEGEIVPEYRDWTITHKGKKLTVSALYVSQTFAKVTLKAEVNGVIREFDITSISREDREYVAQFK